MLVYIIMTIAAILFAYGYSIEKKSDKSLCIKGFFKVRRIQRPSVFVFFVFIVLFLPSALRYGIGTDYFATYVPLFYRIKQGLSGFNEIGFTFFVKTLANITENYQWLFVITSFFTIGLTISAMCRESKSLALSIYIYITGCFYFYGYSGIRQALATSIFLFSIRFIKQKNLIKFIICIGIAVCIHTMALVYLPVYFLYNIKINIKERILFIAVLFVIRPFLGGIIRTLILKTSYSWYIGSKFDTGESGLLLMLINIGTLILGLMFCYKKDDFYSRLYINMHTVSAVLSFYASFLPVGIRMVYLFFFINVLSVPHFLGCIKESANKKIVYLIVLAVYLFYAHYVIVSINSLNIIPYRSIFSK